MGFLREFFKNPLGATSNALVGNSINSTFKGLSVIPNSIDAIKRTAVLDTMKLAREQEDGLKNYDAGPVINSVIDLQGSIGERKDALRLNRDSLVDTRSQPRRQQIAEQAGLAERSVRTEGSRSFLQRTDLGSDTALANQQVQVQSLGEQLQTEGGVRALELETTAFFNELGANRFSREISGLTEQMNNYLSEQGAKIGYEQLAAESRKATMEMYGRFAATIGQEISRDKEKPNYNSGSVTQKPSIFNS